MGEYATSPPMLLMLLIRVILSPNAIAEPWALTNLSFQGREVIPAAVYRLRALVIQALQEPWLGQTLLPRPFMYSSPTVPFPPLITKN